MFCLWQNDLSLSVDSVMILLLKVQMSIPVISHVGHILQWFYWKVKCMPVIVYHQMMTDSLEFKFTFTFTFPGSTLIWLSLISYYSHTLSQFTLMMNASFPHSSLLQ